MNLLLIIIAVLVLFLVALIIWWSHLITKTLRSLDNSNVSKTKVIFCEECGGVDGYLVDGNEYVAECCNCNHLCEVLELD